MKRTLPGVTTSFDNADLRSSGLCTITFLVWGPSCDPHAAVFPKDAGFCQWLWTSGGTLHNWLPQFCHLSQKWNRLTYRGTLCVSVRHLNQSFKLLNQHIVCFCSLFFCLLLITAVDNILCMCSGSLNLCTSKNGSMVFRRAQDYAHGSISLKHNE